VDRNPMLSSDYDKLLAQAHEFWTFSPDKSRRTVEMYLQNDKYDDLLAFVQSYDNHLNYVTKHCIVRKQHDFTIYIRPQFPIVEIEYQDA